MMSCAAAGWCAGKNVFPSLLHAGMQLSVVGIGLPGLTGCTLLYSVLLIGVVRSFYVHVFVVAWHLLGLQ